MQVQLTSPPTSSPVRVAAPAEAAQAAPLAGLTWTQYLIWSHQRLHPTAPLYNVPFTYTIHGPVDAARLGQALRAVVAESESLRSVFGLTPDGQPQRRLLAHVPVELPLVDLAAAPDPMAAYEAWLAERSRRVFALDQPLFDTALVALGDATVWYFNAHHLIVDGASGLLLYQRARQHYEYLLATGELAPPVSNAFSGALAAEADYCRSADYAADQAYWQAWAGPARPPTPLYYAPPAAAADADTLPAHAHLLDLGPDRTAALFAHLAAADAPSANVALLNVWLSVLAVYAHRLGGVSPVSVATPFANRRGPDALADLIAPLLTEVPLSATLDGATTWRALLAQVGAQSAAAYQHRRHPFQAVVGALPGLVVNLHNWAACPPLAGAPVTFALRYVPSTDKTLIAHVRPRHQSPSGSLTVELIASAAQLSAAQLHQTGAHLLKLVDSYLSQSAAPIAQAVFATTDASVWAGAALAGAPEDVVTAIARQAARTPNAPAAVLGAATLTYAALQQRAAAVARALRAQGVGPGARVAVVLERSLEAPAALLAVLHTGAAYVPLDPDQPPARLAEVLADAEAAVVLTNAALAPRLPAGAPLLTLESVAPLTGEAAAPAAITGAEPAVLIYTSGSTGRPKGVVISRRALAAHVHSARAAYALTAADRVLQFAALSFDTASEQIFTALTAGARVVLRGPPPWSAPELAQVLRQQAVTVANLPTAYWQQVTAAWAAQPRQVEGVSLRLVLVGGEALPPAALDRWRQIPALAGARVLNVYGPTEATVTALAADVSAGPLADAAGVPIGQPFPGRTAAVLDAYGAPQPLGAVGELVLGGLGLSDGYWRAPALTEARFTVGPLGRQYHTGDQVYAAPNGQLVYLGRRDRQVKVRGVRVELAEIEAALAAHPAVQAAAVVAQSMEGEVTLTAYVAARAPATELIPLLRDHLRARLPAAMLPTAWAVQSALPLTRHGKIDYAALAALPLTAPLLEPAEVEIEPATALEVTLLNIWREVLRQPRLGRHANFFEAGGHSLLAARLFARLETELGVRLPVAILAQAGSVAQLAAHLASSEPDRAWPLLVRLTPTGDRPPLFCVHGFGGGVLGYMALARALGPEQPFYALAARGLDSAQAPDADVRVMAARYAEVVRATQPHGPYYLAGYCFGGVVAYELAVQLTQAGERVAFVGLFEGYAPRTGRPLAQPPAGAAGRFVRNLPYWGRDFVGLHWRRWRARWGGPAADGSAPANEAALAQVRHIQAQHDLALQRYAPPAYAGDLHLFRARGHALRRALDPLRGWGGLAAGPVHLHLLAGSHYNILEAPYVAAFARQLAAALAHTTAAGDA